MSRHAWIAVTVAASLSILVLAVVAFGSGARAPIMAGPNPGWSESDAEPPEVREPDDVTIRAVAKDFLSLSAEGNAVEACLMVIDNGGILNACENDLRKRKDWTALSEMHPKIEVVGLDRHGDKATITGEHLKPAMPLTIEIVRTEYGSWKVRKLNGKAIVYEEADTRRR